MNMVATRCIVCFDKIELVASMITVSAAGWFSFECPACGEKCVKEASFTQMTALANAGAKVVAQAAPETRVRVDEHDESAPAFTLDDVIDLHLELRDDAALVRWMEGADGAK
jgi:hypothetical protein